MISQFLVAIALQVIYATPYWAAKSSGEKESNQGWHMCRHTKNPSKLLPFMPTASSQEASALDRVVGVLQKTRQYFLNSADISCYVQASPFSHWVSSETLNKQKHLKGKPINISASCIYVTPLELNNWSKIDTVCILYWIAQTDPGSSKDYEPDCGMGSHTGSSARIFNNAIFGR